ncbi:hypothetical protein [Noviherbaspirillum sp.]|uniref:hypothetical protein n=1 Tax=Noviherbaspirillum sp. TaxID=1926288 RepID=UPI002FE14A56
MHLHTDHAATIVVVRGQLTLTTAPQWLGEQVVTTSVLLMEGQAQCAETGGWISLRARMPSENQTVAGKRRAPAWRGFLQRLLLAVGAWRRHLPGLG